MEDRLPTGLLLEMIRPAQGAGPEEAALFQREVAIPKALASGAYARATAFSNLRPEESRYPRKIEEFSHLTVYEIEEHDVAGAHERGRASLPDGDGRVLVDRLVYRRYPRASQGVLTGKRTNGIFLVLISPTERSRAQELRDWADFIHIHYIAAAMPAGFTTITPYENVAGEDPLFLHFYELDADDPAAAADAMPDAVLKRWGFQMGDEPFWRWAMIDSLDIRYVNVFGRIGA